MVVTRRTPVVPPPPPVRTHSSQGTHRPPRASFSRNQAGASKDPDPGLPAASLSGSSTSDKGLHSGPDGNPEKKAKKSKRRARNKHRKSNFEAFLDFLTKLLLLAFTIYTFAVCPQDTHLQSPICRGLTEYKRVVIDPYIIPPIYAVLAHPSVAPHIERAKPYVERAVGITTPILLRTRQQWNLHIVPQWKKRIIPEWNKRVLPQWNKYVIPQWDKHVAPRIQRIQSTLEPHFLHATQNYEQRIVPHVRVAVYNLQRWQRQVEPYVLLAASKTKNAYYAAKPFAIPIAKRSGHLLHQFALFLREQRRKFVDPHVAKMWEKIKELSRGKQAVHGVTLPENVSLSSDTPVILTTIMETPVYETAVSSTHSPISAHDPISIFTEGSAPESTLRATETTEVIPTASFTGPSFTPVPGPATPTRLPDTFAGAVPFPRSEPVLAESSYEPDHLRPTFTSADRLDTATSPISVADTVTWSSKPSPVADGPIEFPTMVTPSKITAAAASATVPPTHPYADEIDFDAFYAELGLEEPLINTEATVEHHSRPPSTSAETEEEKAERLRLKAEETARKRTDIEARQTKWEVELRAQMGRSTAHLQNRLGDLRAGAAAELVSSAEVRSSIEELVSEAEKYLKGAEIYLKNLKGESRRPDEKLALWDRVAERVNDKFNERLSAAEGVINVWYRIIHDNELQEVTTAAAEVREVAEKGQLDLGLDYAWLEDVTFNDWQRYHALIGASDQYADEAASIQNGTHPKIVVINPITPIFEDLESEVRDVVIGFETRLRRIKRDGERAFNYHGSGAGQKEEEKGSVVEPEGETEPKVSIVPIPREDSKEEKQGSIPPVVIGRSQREVLEALGKVEPVGVTDRPAKGSDVSPEEAVSRLAQEVVGSREIHHMEL